MYMIMCGTKGRDSDRGSDRDSDRGSDRDSDRGSGTNGESRAEE